MAMGDRIREKRIEKGLTMEQLADRLGVGRSAVNKWEKGHVQNIKRSTIEKMCTIFDCSPGYLFALENDETEEPMYIEIEPIRKSETLTRLLAYCKLLNPEAQNDLLKYAKYLNEQKDEEA